MSLNLALCVSIFDYPAKQSLVYLLVSAATPVFVLPDVLKIIYDDRGDATNICIVNKGIGKAVEQFVSLISAIALLKDALCKTEHEKTARPV